jgi:hypothetical protein
LTNLGRSSEDSSEMDNLNESVNNQEKLGSKLANLFYNVIDNAKKTRVSFHLIP